MTWEQQATLACREWKLEVVGFEGGYVFVKNYLGDIHPLDEVVVAKWIREYKEKKELVK